MPNTLTKNQNNDREFGDESLSKRVENLEIGAGTSEIQHHDFRANISVNYEQINRFSADSNYVTGHAYDHVIMCQMFRMVLGDLSFI
jgi:hypothetical protein